jgi:hypothetical protein
MTRRTTAAMTLGAAALLGCATQPGGQPAVAPSGPLVCALATTRANTCEAIGNRTVCHVYVAGTRAAPFVYPYQLDVPPGAPNVTIVWTVLDRVASFRDKNDGPGLAGPNFTGGDTSDHGDGASTSGREARHYRVQFSNAPLPSPVQYMIKFKTDDGTVTECDPRINNSG